MIKFDFLLFISISSKILTFLDNEKLNKILLNIFCYNDLLFYVINLFSSNSFFYIFENVYYVANLILVKQMLANDNKLFPYIEFSVINSIIFLQIKNFNIQNYNSNIQFLCNFYLFCCLILIFYLLFFVNASIEKILTIIQYSFLLARISSILIYIITKN